MEKPAKQFQSSTVHTINQPSKRWSLFNHRSDPDTLLCFDSMICHAIRIIAWSTILTTTIQQKFVFFLYLYECHKWCNILPIWWDEIKTIMNEISEAFSYLFTLLTLVINSINGKQMKILRSQAFLENEKTNKQNERPTLKKDAIFSTKLGNKSKLHLILSPQILKYSNQSMAILLCLMRAIQSPRKIYLFTFLIPVRWSWRMSNIEYQMSNIILKVKWVRVIRNFILAITFE